MVLAPWYEIEVVHESIERRNLDDLSPLLKQAISEREQLQQNNYQLQHKLVEHFNKQKKADEARQDYDKNEDLAELEQSYLKYMAQLVALQRYDMRKRENYKQQIQELKARCEEKKERVEDKRRRFLVLKKQVAQNSLNSRSGRQIPPEDIESYLSAQTRKEAVVVNVRLIYIKLKNKVRKMEHQLESKGELAEGLHLIDYEQLQNENQTYNDNIEEGYQDLMKLRYKVVSSAQVLTHLKEKLQNMQAENQIQKRNLHEEEAEARQKRDILSRTKQARDALKIDNKRLRENCSILGNESLLIDFEERKNEGDQLRIKLERLKDQLTEIKLQSNKVERKIEQARNRRAYFVISK